MYSISETAKILGVSAPTLRRWEKTGKLPALRTLGGHRRYPEQYIRCAIEGKSPEPEQSQSSSTTTTTITEQRTDAIYARVSTYKQSADGNLERQIERIKKHAQLLENTPIFAEYGSGLNTDRRGLNRLLKSVEKRQISTIYIEYRDRLTRFGFGFLERYCGYFGTRIVAISNNEHKSPAEELSEDIMALLACFSGRLYSKRRAGKNYSSENSVTTIIEKKIGEFNDCAWIGAVSAAIAP